MRRWPRHRPPCRSRCRRSPAPGAAEYHVRKRRVRGSGRAHNAAHAPRSRRLLPRARRARRALRRPLLRRRVVDARLLPSGVLRPHASTRELPLLPERGGRRGRRLSALHALPPRARAGPRERGRVRAARARRGEPDAGGIEHLAARVGVTSRHLRRIFETEFGVSPIEFAQTHRLLLAKRLLTDTPLPVTEIALASGFASVRRFNALFRARYRMAPARLRARAETGSLPAALAFELAYRPPYDWDAMLDFLRARAVPGVEHAGVDFYARSLAVAHRGSVHAGRIEVRRARRRHALSVAVSPSLARAVPAVLSRVKHAFDLACDPAQVAAALGELGAARPGLRV